MNKRVVMQEAATIGFAWEDPECDPVAAIRQIQEVLDAKL